MLRVNSLGVFRESGQLEIQTQLLTKRFLQGILGSQCHFHVSPHSLKSYTQYKIQPCNVCNISLISALSHCLEINLKKISTVFKLLFCSVSTQHPSKLQPELDQRIPLSNNLGINVCRTKYAFYQEIRNPTLISLLNSFLSVDVNWVSMMYQAIQASPL